MTLWVTRRTLARSRCVRQMAGEEPKDEERARRE